MNQMIDGRTPLHYAADYGQGDVLRYLLEKGANANVRLRRLEHRNDETHLRSTIVDYFFFISGNRQARNHNFVSSDLGGSHKLR